MVKFLNNNEVKTLKNRVRKTVVVLGDGWWPPTAKQDGDKVCERFLSNVRKECRERPDVRGDIH